MKNCYYISRNYKFAKNAASKPKMDCETILANNGFVNLGFKQTNYASSAVGAVISFFGITKGLFLLPSKSIFCMQYPLSKFFAYIVSIVRLKNCTLIMIIHDIKFLMGKTNNLPKEMAKFNKADYLIVHNESMKKWFQENGCTAQLVTLEIFDYLHEAKKGAVKTNPYQVVFAGGLGKEKAEFLYSTDELRPKNYTMKLYGNGFNKNNLTESESVLDYQGSFSPEEVIDEIEGSFGLVWNGNSLDSCDGDFGKYLLYNNPHKTSLYILCGLPVIVWKKAAIAQFIEKENIGITLNSLRELDDILDGIDGKEYSQMSSNVKETQQKVATGHFLSEAISKVLKKIES